MVPLWQVVVGVQFTRSCIALLRSRITPVTVRRMSLYLCFSVGFMSIGMLSTVSIAMVSMMKLVSPLSRPDRKSS